MNIKISDSGLIDQIIKLLIELRKEIQHPELESVLKRLFDLSGDKYLMLEVHEEPVLDLEDRKMIAKAEASSEKIRSTPEKKPAMKKARTATERKPEEDTRISFITESLSLRWDDVFKIIR